MRVVPSSGRCVPLPFIVGLRCLHADRTLTKTCAPLSSNPPPFLRVLLSPRLSPSSTPTTPFLYISRPFPPPFPIQFYHILPLFLILIFHKLPNIRSGSLVSWLDLEILFLISCCVSRIEKMACLVSRTGRELQRYNHMGFRQVVGWVLFLSLFTSNFLFCLFLFFLKFS